MPINTSVRTVQEIYQMNCTFGSQKSLCEGSDIAEIES